MDRTVTVLIVDDDITNRLVLRSLLKESGFTVVEAEDGQQAVEQAEKYSDSLDIVLMDVMMPVMDGYEATRIIKQQASKFIPIIFLTALSDEESLAQCIESGGDDFLTKPYNHVLLRAKIDSMLRIVQLYRKIENQNNELNRHNVRIEQEINVAKNVFGNMLKHDLRGSVTGLRYSMSPMSIFNGDMILAERNHTDGLDVMISDFTGHGLSAAIGSIPVADVFYTMIRKGFSFTETLAEINNKLVKLLPTQMFMAAAAITINRGNNVVTVINAGLPELYLYRNGEIIRTFKSRNIPLGISKLKHDAFEMEMATLEYGDRILAATDGIMEAENELGEMYGKQRILQSMQSVSKDDQLFDQILQDCLAFSSLSEQNDDITLLELCHQKKVEFEQEDFAPELKPANWSIQFSFDIDSLRHFDVLPYIMQGVNGLQSIPNGRSTVHTLLAELYANALDHGLLGLDSSIKSTPAGYMEFYQQKSERLETVQEGTIQIMLTQELKDDGGGRLIIHVVDSGEGFDYQNINSSLASNQGYAGRGLELIRHLCQDVKFLGKGNAIMVVYDWE